MKRGGEGENVCDWTQNINSENETRKYTTPSTPHEIDCLIGIYSININWNRCCLLCSSGFWLLFVQFILPLPAPLFPSISNSNISVFLRIVCLVSYATCSLRSIFVRSIHSIEWSRTKSCLFISPRREKLLSFSPNHLIICGQSTILYHEKIDFGIFSLVVHTSLHKMKCGIFTIIRSNVDDTHSVHWFHSFQIHRIEDKNSGHKKMGIVSEELWEIGIWLVNFVGMWRLWKRKRDFGRSRDR